MRYAVLATVMFVAVPVHSARAAAGVILDESSYWRRYLRFAVPRFSAQVLKSQGAKLVGPKAIGQAKRNTEWWMRKKGIDPARNDWRDHVTLALRGAREFMPVPAAAPPDGWSDPGFDDSTWVRRRHPFQGGRLSEVTHEILGQYSETVDLRLQSAWYRGRFVVDDPGRAGSASVRVVYSGGVRMLVNGEEIGRGHLPQGQLQPDTPAAEYPAQAYGPDAARLCQRALGPVRIPAAKLRRGVNVLGIEVRASQIHPIVLKNPHQPNWGGPRRPWPHARLIKVELRSISSAIRSGTGRPSGTQVWVEDVNHRVESNEYLPPGEDPGSVRIVGARNGTYSAQVVVGTSRPLTGLRVKPGDLTAAGGKGRLPASAFEVFGLAPYPADEFVLRKLGDERGLGASFPSPTALGRLEAMRSSLKPHVFDHLVESSGARVPGGTCRPVLLRLRIPATAAPGTYRGSVEVSAGGMKAAKLPVEVEVVGWTLSDPGRFKTFVGCEQNPYGVAKHYGAPLWSDKHFRLVESSMKELGRVGNSWLNIPVLRRSEFGNLEDSMIRCARRRDGSFAFDYSTLDRYLDMAVKHWGRPRVILFAVMHGMKSAAQPPTPPQVNVKDEATGRVIALPVGPPAQNQQAKASFWRAFATSLRAHMRAKGLEKRIWWGYPLETEADPGLKNMLANFAPGIHWVAGPHEMMANGTFAKKEQFYKLVADIRYQGGWGAFREDMGWKSRTTHLLNPRVGGTAFALHTTSRPYAYRMLPERALSMGRNGFTRVGADEWAGVHFNGMAIPRWLTGVPVLWTLWPGKNGAESSQRFEMLLEGIQETEARIFLEQALDGGRLPTGVAAKVRKLLRARFEATTFFQGNSVVYSMEEYHQGWQERSRALYRAAADVAKLQGN